MKRLLILLLGTVGLTVTAVSPIIINKVTTNFRTNTTNSVTKEKQLNAEITISNSKHKDANDEPILGIKEYKDEFAKSINTIRAKLAQENATNISVSNIITKFQVLPNSGKITLAPEIFSNLLTAKTVEITSLEVTIGNAGPYLNTYQILYSAIIDGKEVKRVNINGYGWRQLHLGSTIINPYSITFDITYKTQDIIDNI